MKKEVYLDNSATTRVLPEAAAAVSYVMSEAYGNPSSLHTKGIEAERILKTSRDTVASALGAKSTEVCFTSGGTESNNLAIRGYLSGNPRKGRRIITTRIEHPSVLEVFRQLESEGYEVIYLDVDKDGIVSTDKLEEAVNTETSLISFILVNNETGAIQPVKEITGIIRKRTPEAVIHVDAVQAFGKIRLEPEKLGIDLMSISSHKIHGPKGAGALYVRKGARLKPVVLGGGQEAALRSGTENVPGIAGFGKAAEIVLPDIDKNRTMVKALKDKFIGLLKDSGFDCAVVSPEQSSPYVLNVGFAGLKAEVLLHHLEQEGIYVSTGSACSSRKKVQSHVLAAIGLETAYIEGAIRFSFSAYENNEEDINITVDALKRIIPVISKPRRIGK